MLASQIWLRRLRRAPLQPAVIMKLLSLVLVALATCTVSDPHLRGKEAEAVESFPAVKEAEEPPRDPMLPLELLPLEFSRSPSPSPSESSGLPRRRLDLVLADVANG
eukprot:Skav200466  [mRNA]  locus=scaffold1350:207869:208189:+ [translate_table: standard]